MNKGFGIRQSLEDSTWHNIIAQNICSVTRIQTVDLKSNLIPTPAVEYLAETQLEVRPIGCRRSSGGMARRSTKRFEGRSGGEDEARGEVG